MTIAPASPRLPLLFIICLVCTLLAACAGTPEAREASAPAASTAADPALLRQADECYAQRADLERLRAGLLLLRRARAVAPGDYEAAWRAARLNYTLGDLSKNEQERTTAFHDGIEAGETAVRVSPGRVEGHFWLGANYGGYAQTQGPLAGLSYADKLRKEMEAAEKITPGLYGGSVYLALGRLDLELPEWLGGDHQRALATLEKGLSYGPQNCLLRLQLARAYLANKRPDDARKQLTYILAMQPDPDFLLEFKQCETESRELLKK